MTRSRIEWTDRVWNPVRGCSRVSEGCRHCYAERQAARFSDPGQYAHGFVERAASGPRWTGRVELVEAKLNEPLSWRRPSRVFVNSMSDLFHESLPDEALDLVFERMLLPECDKHTFQILTKRPARMGGYMRGLKERWGGRWPFDGEWPPRNVWLGVSVEDQATADERIPLLLDTTAAVRFVSAEPLIGRIDLDACGATPCEATPRGPEDYTEPQPWRGIDWLIVGGESGPGARPCCVQWIEILVGQCREANVPVFVKQLGADPRWAEAETLPIEPARGKCNDPSEWPEALRVREFPTGGQA